MNHSQMLRHTIRSQQGKALHFNLILTGTFPKSQHLSFASLKGSRTENAIQQFLQHGSAGPLLNTSRQRTVVNDAGMWHIAAGKAIHRWRKVVQRRRRRLVSCGRWLRRRDRGCGTAVALSGSRTTRCKSVSYDVSDGRAYCHATSGRGHLRHQTRRLCCRSRRRRRGSSRCFSWSPFRRGAIMMMVYFSCWSRWWCSSSRRWRSSSRRWRSSSRRWRRSDRRWRSWTRRPIATSARSSSSSWHE